MAGHTRAGSPGATGRGDGGQPCLCDLHLRIDRPAQGGARAPSRRLPSDRRWRATPAAGPGEPRDAEHLALLRRLGPRDLLGVRGGSRDGALPGRPDGDRPGGRAAPAGDHRARHHAGCLRDARPGGDPFPARSDRRRRGLPAGPGRPLVVGPGAHQLLRAHRDHDLLDGVALPAGIAGSAADRPAGRGHPRLRPRPAVAARPDQRHRRDLPRRRRGGARLSRPAGPDGGEVRARPLRRRARGAPLPHRRPRPPAGRRRAGVRRPQRRAGEAPRLPDRAGGDRGGAPPPPRGRAGGRDGPRGLARHPAPGGLRRAEAGRDSRWRRPARLSQDGSAGVHGPRGRGGARHPAAHDEPQGGPQGPAGARGGARRHGALRGAAQRRRAPDRRGLARGAPGRARGGERQLLRPRRPLAADGPRAHPAAGGISGLRPGAGRPLQVSYRRRPRGPPERGRRGEPGGADRHGARPRPAGRGGPRGDRHRHHRHVLPLPGRRFDRAVLGEPDRRRRIDHVLQRGAAAGRRSPGGRPRQSPLRPGAGDHRRRRGARRRLLRLQPARGGGDGPAAADLPRVCLGSLRGGRSRSRAHPGRRRRVRGRRLEHLRLQPPGGPGDPGLGGELPGHDRQRQGFPRLAGLLQAGAPRAQPLGADRVLDLAGGGPPRLPEPALGRVRRRARRGRLDPAAAGDGLPAPRGSSALARRPLPRLRRPGRRHRGRQRGRSRAAQAPGGRPARTAIASTPSSRARRSTTTAR